MNMDFNSIKSAYELFMKNKATVDHEDIKTTTVAGDLSAIIVEVSKVNNN